MEIEIYEMKYKAKKDDKNLRILGDIFVTNNKNKGKLIINNKKYPIKSYISINNKEKKKIKLALNANIYDKRCIFKNCQSLESISRLLKRR